MDEMLEPRTDIKVVLIAIVILIMFGLWFSGSYSAIQKDAVVINKTVLIEGKICPNPQGLSMIQDENGSIYDIPQKDCDKYPVGKTMEISYNHIHQYLASDEYDFNKTVGEY
jgi:hypothetical protein